MVYCVIEYLEILIHREHCSLIKIGFLRLVYNIQFSKLNIFYIKTESSGINICSRDKKFLWIKHLILIAKNKIRKEQ
jgi:hypothetical protein